MFGNKEYKYIHTPVPTLHPMGCMTFAVACAVCKNRNKGFEFCRDCRCEVKSLFEADNEKIARLQEKDSTSKED